jgi:outer membrane immunogenic protein
MEASDDNDIKTNRQQYTAGLRGRVGRVYDNVLMYGTAGVAMQKGQISDDEDSVSVDFNGISAGAGLEWSPTPGMRLRTELMFTTYSGEITELDPDPFSGRLDRFEIKDQIELRVGLNWNLGKQGADLDEMPDATHDWSGLYAGALVGVGLLDTSGVHQWNDSSSAIDLGAITETGLAFGGSVGWNHQSGNAVYGITADIMKPNWGASFSQAQDTSDIAESNFDYIATLRARAGIASDKVLFFGTAGVANIGGEIIDADNDIFETVTNVGFNATLPVVGIGMEWAKTDRMSIVIEGLKLVGSDKTDLGGITPASGIAYSEDFLAIDGGFIGRIGVNFSF